MMMRTMTNEGMVQVNRACSHMSIMRRQLSSGREQIAIRLFLRSCTRALMEEMKGEKGI